MTLTDDDRPLSVTTPNDTDIVLVRTFDAPCRLVFDALTRPDLLVRWHGAQGWNLTVCEVDLRVGGNWRFVAQGPDGAEMGMRGTYRELDPPRRLVYTEVFDGSDRGEALVTAVLDEREGHTTLTSTVSYPTRQARDAVIETAMVDGVGHSFDRLAALLGTAVVADRYRRVADTFGRRLREVPPAAWDNPSPCDGWVTRDVVGHLVEWLPGFFFGTWGIEAPAAPAVADDPLGAWLAVDGAIRAALDDPAVADATRDTPLGPKTFAAAVDMICTPDVLVHTWDVARAAGLDETIDLGVVRRLFGGMEAHDEAMRQSGQYGPRVPVPDDADDQTKLLAFMGRRP